MEEVTLIGDDIQGVIGSAIAIHILSNGVFPLWAGVVITIFENYGVRKLEVVFVVFIATKAVSFAWQDQWQVSNDTVHSPMAALNNESSKGASIIVLYLYCHMCCHKEYLIILGIVSGLILCTTLAVIQFSKEEGILFRNWKSCKASSPQFSCYPRMLLCHNSIVFAIRDTHHVVPLL